MSVEWTLRERIQAFKVYFENIHMLMNKDDLLNLHTFLYFDNFEVCPICGFKLFAETHES